MILHRQIIGLGCATLLLDAALDPSDAVANRPSQRSGWQCLQRQRSAVAAAAAPAASAPPCVELRPLRSVQPAQPRQRRNFGAAAAAVPTGFAARRTGHPLVVPRLSQPPAAGAAADRRAPAPAPALLALAPAGGASSEGTRWQRLPLGVYVWDRPCYVCFLDFSTI
jgi:hypothetical protein